ITITTRMTSVLMVASGFSRRRLACGLRGVTRFLAAVLFFAMSWSSLDGVAKARHCTSVSHQHAFSIQTDPMAKSSRQNIGKPNHSEKHSRFAHLMCERAVGQPAEARCRALGGVV